jgi:type IV secretory pathway VirB10-like protein
MKKILFRRKVTTIIAALLLAGLVLPTSAFAQRAPNNAAPQDRQERQEPARQERERQEPMRQEPVRQEPVRQEPVRQQPVRQEPVRQERERQERERQERERLERERQERERQARERQERERQERLRPGIGSVTANGKGLTITGLSKYNGYYVVAKGVTTDRRNGSYTALGSLAGAGQSARISGGRVDLMVLAGKNIFAFEGNDTVKFTVVIQRDEAMSSKRYVALGEVTVTFRNGRATGAITRITEVSR